MVDKGDDTRRRRRQWTRVTREGGYNGESRCGGAGEWRSPAGAAAQGLRSGGGGIRSECTVCSAGLRASVVGSAASATTLG